MTLKQVSDLKRDRQPHPTPHNSIAQKKTTFKNDNSREPFNDPAPKHAKTYETEYDYDVDVSLLILNDLISHTSQSRAGSVAYGMMLSEMMGLQAQGTDGFRQLGVPQLNAVLWIWVEVVQMPETGDQWPLKRNIWLAIPGTSKCWGCKWAGLCIRGSYNIIYVILLAVRVCQKILGRQEPWCPFGFPCVVNWLLSYTSAGGHCWRLGRADKAQWTLLGQDLGEIGVEWLWCTQNRSTMSIFGARATCSPWLAPSIWFRLAWEMEEVPKLSYPIVIHSYP